ncbi:MAG: hypothetical protein Q7R70_06610, partial [Candidatus Diapherotrites archaeon]|nr:hypothetical protein [Candidatus Diapherotrites archaeon]
MRKLLLALIVLSIIPFALSDYSTQCSANACINTKLANGITGPSNPFDPAKSCGGGCCEESGFCITTIHFNNAFNGGSCEISGLHGSINNCNTGTRTITNSDPLNVVAYYDFKNITGANGMNLGNFDGTALNFNKPGIGGNWSGFSVWSNGSNAKISIGGTECTTQNCYLSAFNPPQNSGKYSFTSDYPGLKDYLNSGTLMIGAAMHSPEAGTLTGFYNESKFYFNIVNNSSTLKQLVYEGYDPNSNPTPGPDIVRLRASPAIPTPGIPYINVEKLCNTPCRITSTNNGQVVNTPINEGTTSIPFLLSPNTVSGWSDSVVCRDFFSYIKVFPNAFPVTGIFNYHKTEMPLSSTVHYDKACIEPAAFNGEFYSTSFEAKNWTLKYGINASPISSMKFKVLVVGSGGNLLTWQDKTSFSACNSTPGSSGNYYNCSVNILLQKPADNAINSIITSNDGTINPIFEVYTKIGGVDTLTDRFKFLFHMWGIMGLKTSPTGQYLKFATGKSNILAGNGLDVSIRNIS